MRSYENESHSSHSNPAVSPVSLNSRNVPHNFTSVILCLCASVVCRFLSYQLCYVAEIIVLGRSIAMASRF